jgi:Holliday junction resolvase RusA-like endonuclease
MTKDAKDFKQAVTDASFIAVKRMRWNPEPATEYAVMIDAYNTRHDVDGVGVKLILDAMQGHVYANDRQVKRLTVAVCKDGTKRARVDVVVYAL